MQKAGLNKPGFVLKVIVLKEDVQSFIILSHPAVWAAISD